MSRRPADISAPPGYRQDNVGCFQIRSRAADLEAGREQLQRYFAVPESGASMPRPAADAPVGGQHTSARRARGMSAISVGSIRQKVGRRQETQLLGVAQKPALDSTDRFPADGHSASELGMRNNFRGSRMPVRSRVRPVLFMSLSVTARLRVIAKHGCSSSRARRS